MKKTLVSVMIVSAVGVAAMASGVAESTADAKCGCGNKYGVCLRKELKPGQAAVGIQKCDDAFNACIEKCTAKKECKSDCRDAKKEAKDACKDTFADTKCGMKDKDCKKQARKDRNECTKEAGKDKRACKKDCKD